MHFFIFYKKYKQIICKLNSKTNENLIFFKKTIDLRSMISLKFFIFVMHRIQRKKKFNLNFKIKIIFSRIFIYKSFSVKKYKIML